MLFCISGSYWVEGCSSWFGPVPLLHKRSCGQQEHDSVIEILILHFILGTIVLVCPDWLLTYYNNINYVNL